MVMLLRFGRTAGHSVRQRFHSTEYAERHDDAKKPLKNLAGVENSLIGTDSRKWILRLAFAL